ncbi:MAG: hypothetical protein ABJP45_00205 [Cyclobacteriaceae bacterium]
MRNVKAITLLLIIGFGCDQVKDDSFTPVSIDYEAIRYTRADESIIIPVYGDFAANDLSIVSNSDQLTKIEALVDLNGVLFVKYSPDEDPTDFIELEIIQNNAKIASGSLEIRSLGSDDCVNSGFSDHYTIGENETLEVDLTKNDAFCGFFDSGSRAINEVPIANSDGVLIAATPGTATLSYTPPSGFTGKVEFIYEICFGWSEVLGNSEEAGQEIFKNGPKNCQFYYSALATIDVI